MKHCLILVMLFSIGCAAKKPVTKSVLPRACLKSAILTKQSDCAIISEDEMLCNKVKVKIVKDCEQVAVKK